MTDNQQKPTIEVEVTFTATSTLDLNEICQEIGIEVSDIDNLSIKYCDLRFTLKDGREIEYSTTAYEADLDTKYPSRTATFINDQLVATSHEYGGEIELEASQPVMYVLMRYYGTSSEWSPVFASHLRYHCETQQNLHKGVSTRIDTVPTTFFL